MKLNKYLKSFLALLIILYLICKVGFSDIWNQLINISLFDVSYLIYISIVLVYVSALKWKLFLEIFSESVSLLRLFGLYMVGYFINLILPSHIGGDAVRSWQVGKKVGQHEAMAATVLERYTGLVAMLSMAFVFMWFLKSVTTEIKLSIFLLTFIFAVLSALVLSSAFVSILRKFKIPEKFITHFIKLKEALNFAKSHFGLFTRALLLSYIFHIIAVFNVMAAAHAIGWMEVPFFDLFIVLPIILLIGSLPLTPSGLGLQEGAYYFFLQGLGATSAEATAVALILRAKSYILALFGGIFWMFRNKQG